MKDYQTERIPKVFSACQLLHTGVYLAGVLPVQKWILSGRPVWMKLVVSVDVCVFWVKVPYTCQQPLKRYIGDKAQKTTSWFPDHSFKDGGCYKTVVSFPCVRSLWITFFSLVWIFEAVSFWSRNKMGFTLYVDPWKPSTRILNKYFIYGVLPLEVIRL